MSDTVTLTLTDFLLARIAEDEDVARKAGPSPWLYTTVESVGGGALYDRDVTIANLFYEQIGDHDGSIRRHVLADDADGTGAHIARHDPARVLADCAAKRRIVETHRRISLADIPHHSAHAHEVPARCGACLGTGSDGNVRARYPCATLAYLALPYAAHPDYREEWRP